MDENELRRRVQEARADLAELIPDAGERARVDSQLGQALNEPPGNAKSALMAALRSHEAIRRWVAADTDRIFSLAGDVTSPVGVLWVCPKKNYTVMRETPPEEPLVCPKDGSVLERYDR
jgi:hypothetical protein